MTKSGGTGAGFYSIMVFCGVMTTSSISLASDGETSEKKSKKEVGTFSFQLENDLFSGTDRHYTNGIRLSWLSPDGDTVDSLALVRDTLETVTLDAMGRPGEDTEVRFGVSLGQDIYTPEERAPRKLIMADRPYASWLYGAASLHTVFKEGEYPRGLESVEVQVGVVGPAALGEEAQDAIHAIRLIDKFNGWDNQLENEPGFLLLYERKWRVAEPVHSGFGELDIIPRMGGSIGNVLTHANIGVAGRWGWNLPQDFGPANLIHGGVPFPATNRDTLELVGIYLFASTEGRYVAHNLFLDGSTFRDSHSVDRRPWVGDLSFGTTLMIGPVNLTYSNAIRTREYEGQDDISRFGAVTISFEAAF